MTRFTLSPSTPSSSSAPARTRLATGAIAALLFAALCWAPATGLAVQDPQPQTPAQQDKAKSKGNEQEQPAQPQLSQGEIVAELAIIAYGGRTALDAARSAYQEEGTLRLASDQGDLTGSITVRSVRKDKSWQDLLRVDLELNPLNSAPGSNNTLKYTIAFNGGSVWSAQNNQYLTPRADTERAFRAQLSHEFTSLLRYKEDGSKVELVGPETVVGLETNVVELINPEGDKTRFWVSKKTLRVLHVEYELQLSPEQPATRYKVSYFYTPYRVVQNTLTPSRRVMYQDGKFVQEVIMNQFTYSAKIEPEVFQHLQAN